MSAPDARGTNLDDYEIPLPSPDTSATSDEDDAAYLDAERQWQESLEQIELVLTMVLIPYIGKYFGRKLAYWGWAKFMTWKYPVEVVITDPTYFKITGAVQAAATL